MEGEAGEYHPVVMLLGEGWVVVGQRQGGRGMRNQMGHLDPHLESIIYIELWYFIMDKTNIPSLIQ